MPVWVGLRQHFQVPSTDVTFSFGRSVLLTQLRPLIRAETRLNFKPVTWPWRLDAGQQEQRILLERREAFLGSRRNRFVKREREGGDIRLTWLPEPESSSFLSLMPDSANGVFFSSKQITAYSTNSPKWGHHDFLLRAQVFSRLEGTGWKSLLQGERAKERPDKAGKLDQYLWLMLDRGSQDHRTT